MIITVVVVVTPHGQVVSIPGGSAQFSCTILPNDGVVAVEWLINGTVLENPSLSGATVDFFPGLGSRLVFASLSPKFNVTRIACRVVFTDGNKEDSTESTTCLLQGYNYNNL